MYFDDIRIGMTADIPPVVIEKEKMLSFARDYEKQIEMLMEFYIENTKYTEEEIEENIQTDWYIRMDEATEKGLVDGVITDIDILC